MDPLAASEDSFSVQIQSSTKKAAVKLTLLGPVPSSLSRVSTVLLHTRSTPQASDELVSVNNNKSRVIYSDDTNLRSQLQEGPLLAKVTYNSKDKHAIVTKVDDTHYMINYVSSLVNPSSRRTYTSYFKSMDPTVWTTTTAPLSATPLNLIKLSMAPPINSSPVQKSDNEDMINDPYDYFLDKYFSNLYMLTTPLTFFVKSVFPRLMMLCANDPQIYESILKKFIIKIDQFDTRHLISSNGLLNSSSLFEKEELYRKDFIQKSLNLVDFDIHSSNFQETNRSLVAILNNFKVREIHIQVLILLELICVTNRDDPKLFKAKKKKQSRKPSLVGKKKLTPIINGGAIPTRESSVDADPQEELTYNQLLDAYLEKLLINDLLNGHSSSEYYSPKFINHIVAPFFDKRCPNTTMFMIKKIKGPSFKPAATSSKMDRKRSSSVSSDTSTSSQSNKKPALQRSSTSIKLEDIAELKISLTRSNSDLQSLKRTSSFNSNTLSKRQIDMSLPTIPSEPRPLKKTSSQIFNRIGKKKVTSSSLKLTQSISQVEATPMKKTKTVDVMGTPVDAQINSVEKSVKSNSIHSSSPVYERTPMQPLLQSPIAIRSTARKPGEPIDFNERGLLGSPVVAKNVKRRLFAPPPAPKKT